VKQFIDALGVEHVPAGHAEKLVAGLGGFVSLALLAVFNDFWNGSAHAVLLLSSMGSSIVLLFAAPHAAASQPWPVVGGHVVSALAAVACMTLLGDVVIAAPVAIAVAISGMYYLRCMHAPGGATAVVAVAAVGQGAGFGFVLDPVLVSVSVLLVVTMIFNYPFPWRRYPSSLVRRPSEVPASTGLSQGDIRYALENAETFVDVTEEDVAELYRLAQDHARLEQDCPGGVCCVERGTGVARLVEGLEQSAEGPVFYKVMSVRRVGGKPLLLWSKYEEANAETDVRA